MPCNPRGNRVFCLMGWGGVLRNFRGPTCALERTGTFQGAISEVQFGDVAQISDVCWQGEASVAVQIHLDSLCFHFDDGKRQFSCLGGSTYEKSTQKCKRDGQVHCEILLSPPPSEKNNFRNCEASSSAGKVPSSWLSER